MWRNQVSWFLEQWLDSHGHYENIVNPDYVHIGIGVYRNRKNRIYMTQNFGIGPHYVKARDRYDTTSQRPSRSKPGSKKRNQGKCGRWSRRIRRFNRRANQAIGNVLILLGLLFMFVMINVFFFGWSLRK